MGLDKKSAKHKSHSFNQAREGSQPGVPGPLPLPLVPSPSGPLLPAEPLSVLQHQESPFLAQHQMSAKVRARKTMKIMTPLPPCTCSTVRTKMPEADDLSWPVPSPPAAVVVGEPTATSRGPHISTNASQPTVDTRTSHRGPSPA